MQHDARDYGGLLQDTHTEVTGQQKKPATGGVTVLSGQRLVWCW